MRLKLLRSPICSGLLFAVIGQFTFGSLSVWSQEYGNCEEGKASVILEGGNVRAKIFNTGGLFWNGDPNVYEVPKGSGKMSHLTATFLAGGFVDGTLRMSAARFGGYELWPGPIGTGDAPLSDCSAFDKIYYLKSSDIEGLKASGGRNERIESWPASLGAPVLDGDGRTGNFSLGGGDVPHMFGNEMAWWVMNDRGNEHTATGALPLGIEVQASAFVVDSFWGEFDTTTFYDYLIIYKGKTTVKDLRIGFWHDVDLGGPLSAQDDMVGSDSLLSLGYVYAYDDYDQTYEDRPPAIGHVFIDFSEDNFDTSASSIVESYKSWEPSSALEYYNQMSCRDVVGLPVGEFSNGPWNPDPQPHTCFNWPGDPVTGEGISMEHPGAGREKAPDYDKRFVIAAGPFTLAPGDSIRIPSAIVWARGKDRFDSVVRMKKLAQEVKGAFIVAQGGPPYPWNPNHQEPIIPGFFPTVAGELSPQVGSVFPNPAKTSISVNYWVPAAQSAQLKLVDVLGRSVLSRSVYADKGENQESLSLAELPPGIYLLEVTGLHGSDSTKISVVR